MEFTDMIRSMSLLLSFVLVVCWERRIWMTADALAAAGFGLGWVLFPRAMLEFQVDGTVADLHVQLSQVFGLSLLCSALFYYFTRDTRDGTVPITIMTARVFTCGVTLLSQVYVHWMTTRGKKNISWNEKHMSFGIFGIALWLLGNIIHLLRSHDFSTYPQFNVRINSHLKVDAFVNAMIGLLFLAFPDAILHHLFVSTKMDVVLLHLVRSVGIQLLGSALISMQAGGFLHEHDKRYHFWSSLVAPLSMFLLFGYFQITYNTLGTAQWKGMALVASPLLLNGVLGYFSEGTMFYYAGSNKSN